MLSPYVTSLNDFACFFFHNSAFTWTNRLKIIFSGTLTQAIRNFAKSLEGWLTNAMSNFPQEIIRTKVGGVPSSFCEQLCVRIWNHPILLFPGAGGGGQRLCPDAETLHQSEPPGPGGPCRPPEYLTDQPDAVWPQPGGLC